MMVINGPAVRAMCAPHLPPGWEFFALSNEGSIILCFSLDRHTAYRITGADLREAGIDKLIDIDEALAERLVEVCSPKFRIGEIVTE